MPHSLIMQTPPDVLSCDMMGVYIVQGYDYGFVGKTLHTLFLEFRRGVTCETDVSPWQDKGHQCPFFEGSSAIVIAH